MVIVVLVSFIVASNEISNPDEFVSFKVITSSTLVFVRAVLSEFRIGSVILIVILDVFETPVAPLTGLKVASGGTEGVYPVPSGTLPSGTFENNK